MPHIKHALIRYRIIDRCIRNTYNPYPSKDVLREACEDELFGSTSGGHICNSTIEKDMFAMKMEHDAPIRYSKRYNGYYYEDPSFTLNDIPLTEEDLASIQFAAYTLMQFKDVDMFKQFGNAIDKIVDRVELSKKQPNEELDQFIQFESALSTGGNEYLPQLVQAIRNKQIVYFSYAGFKTTIAKPRKVVPVLVKEYRNRWYLISYDLVKQDIITYGLDRIQTLEVSDEIGHVPANFKADEYFRFVTGITVNNESRPEIVQLSVKPIASRYIESQPFHYSQKVIERNEAYVIIQLHILVAEEFIRDILSYGPEIEVLCPESLRKTMIQRAQEMNKIYRK